MACLPRLRRRREPAKVPLKYWPPPRTPPQPPTSPHPQSQTPLFGKLPIELRLEIFTLVLECSPIPIMASSMPRIIKLQHPAWDGDHVEVVRQARLLSLPLTCWRAYIEALPVLYSLNTFIIRSCEPLHMLAAGVGPGTHLIRRLELCWRLDFPPVVVQQRTKGCLMWYINRRFTQEAENWCRRWATTWKAMGKLERLRWLRVDLNVPSFIHRQSWQEHETEILMSLRGVLKDGTEGRLKLTWNRTVAKDKSAEDMLKEWVIERRSD